MQRKTTSVISISWEELEYQVIEMCEKLGPHRPSSICPVSPRAHIPAHLIAYKLGIEVSNQGLKFDIDSSKIPDCCFYKLEQESEWFNKNIKFFLETVDVDVDGKHMKVVYPWEK